MAEAAKLATEVASLRALPSSPRPIPSKLSFRSQGHPSRPVAAESLHRPARRCMSRPEQAPGVGEPVRRKRRRPLSIRLARGPSGQRSLGFRWSVILGTLPTAQRQLQHPFRAGPQVGVRQDQLHRTVDEVQQGILQLDLEEGGRRTMEDRKDALGHYMDHKLIQQALGQRQSNCKSFSL